MKRAACAWIFGALVTASATASGQPVPGFGGPFEWGPDMGMPGGPYGYRAPVRLDVESRSERDVYLIAIRFAGVAADEVKINQEGRELRVAVERSAGGQGPAGRRFSSGFISRSVSLPPDADFSKAQRQEMPGLITYVVPRRFGPWR